MKTTITKRGFDLIEFDDYYGESCSLQKSSIASLDAIWFGIHNAIPKVLSNAGWVDYPIHSDVLLTTRMHLTQDQVKELLPYLIKFAETGNINLTKETK